MRYGWLVAGTKEGYSGYGAEQGMGVLREKIASVLYKGKIQPDEVGGGIGQPGRSTTATTPASPS